LEYYLFYSLFRVFEGPKTKNNYIDLRVHEMEKFGTHWSKA